MFIAGSVNSFIDASFTVVVYGKKAFWGGGGFVVAIPQVATGKKWKQGWAAAPYPVFVIHSWWLHINTYRPWCCCHVECGGWKFILDFGNSAQKNGNLNIHNSMTTGQTPSAEEDRVVWLKAPEQQQTWSLWRDCFANYFQGSGVNFSIFGNV